MNTVLEEINNEINVLQDCMDRFYLEGSNYNSLRYDDCRIEYHMILGMIRIAWLSGSVSLAKINDLYDRVGYVFNHEDIA